jgi:hypothetical protein
MLEGADSVLHHLFSDLSIIQVLAQHLEDHELSSAQTAIDILKGCESLMKRLAASPQKLALCVHNLEKYGVTRVAEQLNHHSN